MRTGQFLDDRTEAFEGRIMALVLAGGRGERLRPLTDHRAKAAVPFGGVCRLIDFVISNLVNSGIRDIHVLTQERADSLIRHLRESWMISEAVDGFMLKPVPPPTEERDRYRGTAQAVYRNLDLIRRGKPDLVLVFGADHVYHFDVRPMIRRHLQKRADISIATLPLPAAACGPFGTVGIDGDGRIGEFREKSPQPRTLAGRSDLALVSMGNYVFNAGVLIDELGRDAAISDSGHDFGRDILPEACRRRRTYAYDFGLNAIPGGDGPTSYWRDVGTIESFYRANMDLNDPRSGLNLGYPSWPLRSIRRHALPAQVVSDLSGLNGAVQNSVLGSATIVTGAYVRDSVIGPNVRIAPGAVVEESVILGNVRIQKRAKIRRAIIDHDNIIGEAGQIGFDRERDAALYHLDPSGIVVVPHAGPSERPHFP